MQNIRVQEKDFIPFSASKPPPKGRFIIMWSTDAPEFCFPAFFDGVSIRSTIYPDMEYLDYELNWTHWIDVEKRPDFQGFKINGGMFNA